MTQFFLRNKWEYFYLSDTCRRIHNRFYNFLEDGKKYKVNILVVNQQAKLRSWNELGFQNIIFDTYNLLEANLYVYTMQKKKFCSSEFFFW